MSQQDAIISFLHSESVLSDDQIKGLLDEQNQTGKNLVNIIKSSNILSQDQLTQVVAIGNNIEFINLSPDSVDPIAVKLVPYEMAREHNLIPVRIDKNCLYVAMSSPMNLSVRDMIATKTGYTVVPLAATVEAVKQAVGYHFNVASITKQDIVSMRLKRSPSESGSVGGRKSSKQMSAQVADAPIVRLVDSIITGAIDAGASDIHIEPQEPDMRVRYRIDGILSDALDIPASAQREVVSHIKILAEMDISERRIPQDGHISTEHNGREFDLRVSSLPAVGGEKIVIRILDAQTGLKGLEDILRTDQDKESFEKLLGNPYGMILLTGPTGSGKTTTLYSIMQRISTGKENIVTVEDPVEYRLKGITQVQVRPEIGRSFASGLRSILRQDPDVILVGEIRDYETAEIAVSAALTGHMVLSTLHTNDSVGAVSRLISLGIAPYQVASALIGIVAQRLVRNVCPNCRKKYKSSLNALSSLEEDMGSIDIYKACGCNECRHQGYRGRSGVYEIFNCNDTIKDMIVDNKGDNQLKKQAVADGMQTLRMQGLRYIREGITTIDELSRVVDMKAM
jgi:type IV pilus assembly protein PilB